MLKRKIANIILSVLLVMTNIGYTTVIAEDNETQTTETPDTETIDISETEIIETSEDTTEESVSAESPATEAEETTISAEETEEPQNSEVFVDDSTHEESEITEPESDGSDTANEADNEDDAEVVIEAPFVETAELDFASPGLTIKVFLEDEAGNTLNIKEPTNIQTDVYCDTSSNPNIVSELNVGEYKNTPDGIYQGNHYTLFNIPVDTDGTGTYSDTINDDGLVYISTPGELIPKSAISADSVYYYQYTYYTTQYADRGSRHDGMNEEHVSSTYSNRDMTDSECFSVPEILGEFTGLDGVVRTQQNLYIEAHHVYSRIKFFSLAIRDNGANNETHNLEFEADVPDGTTIYYSFDRFLHEPGFQDGTPLVFQNGHAYLSLTTTDQMTLPSADSAKEIETGMSGLLTFAWPVSLSETVVVSEDKYQQEKNYITPGNWNEATETLPAYASVRFTEEGPNELRLENFYFQSIKVLKHAYDIEGEPAEGVPFSFEVITSEETPVAEAQKQFGVILSKTTVANENTEYKYKLGEPIEYKITVENVGADPVYNAYLEDEDTGDGWGMDVLMPGEKQYRYTSHAVTEDDIKSSEHGVLNSVYLTAENDSGDIAVDKEAALFVPVDDEKQKLSVFVTVLNRPANGTNWTLGEQIEYNISVKNIGNVTLDDIRITDTISNNIFTPAALAPGGSYRSGRITHTVNPVNLETGGVVDIIRASTEQLEGEAFFTLLSDETATYEYTAAPSNTQRYTTQTDNSPEQSEAHDVSIQTLPSADGQKISFTVDSASEDDTTGNYESSMNIRALAGSAITSLSEINLTDGYRLKNISVTIGEETMSFDEWQEQYSGYVAGNTMLNVTNKQHDTEPVNVGLVLLDSDTMQTIDLDPTRDFVEIYQKDDPGTATHYKLYDTVRLEKGQTYVFTQLATGPEYIPIANTIEFTVNDDGSISVDPRYSSDLSYDSETRCLQVLNKKYVPAYVSVYVPVFKVDGTDYLGVPDAVLTVYDSGNNVVETWLTTGGPHILGSTGRYTPGTYRIVETTVAPGYQLADPIVFEVDADGKVLIDHSQVSQITMVDMPLTKTITITKEWEDNNDADGLRPDDLTIHIASNNPVFQQDEHTLYTATFWRDSGQNGIPANGEQIQFYWDGSKNIWIVGDEEYGDISWVTNPGTFGFFVRPVGTERSNSDITLSQAETTEMNNDIIVYSYPPLTPTCFAADTLVHTDNGLTQISDIRVGDKVLAWNDLTEQNAFKQVSAVTKDEVSEYYVISTGADTVRVTGDHMFYDHDTGKYVAAKNISAGMLLQDVNGSALTVDSVTRESGKLAVYNLQVDDYSNFYVGESGILVYNMNIPDSNGISSLRLTPKSIRQSDTGELVINIPVSHVITVNPTSATAPNRKINYAIVSNNGNPDCMEMTGGTYNFFIKSDASDIVIPMTFAGFEPGVYEYTLRCTDENTERWIYDSKEYIIRIKVTEIEGSAQLEAVDIVNNGNTKYDSAMFQHAYSQPVGPVGPQSLKSARNIKNVKSGAENTSEFTEISFEAVPWQKNGNVWTKEITVPAGYDYKVWEDVPEGYICTNNSFATAVDAAETDGGYTANLINSLETVNETVEVVKIWTDEDNVLESRPDDLLIHILVNGVEVEPASATAWDKTTYASENKWVKTFTVPATSGSIIKVYEDLPEGYEGEHVDTASAATAEFDGSVYTAELENLSPIVFPSSPVNITVQKNVSGRMGNKEKDFQFTIEFDRDVYLNSQTFVPANESYSFSLRHDEHVTFSNIPSGTMYTIIEADYSAEGYSVVSANAAGAATGNLIADFNNINDPLIPTGMYIDRNAAASGTIAVLAILMLLLLRVRKKLNIDAK